jgi:hypothetical protein
MGATATTLFAVAWAGFIIYLATRKQTEQENFLLVTWCLMIGATIASVLYALLK